MKWSVTGPEGRVVTLACMVRDSWFGHGTLLGQFDRNGTITALRDSRVTCMPKDVFDWLLANSIEFNNHLLNDLNERLQWFLRAFSSRATLSVDEQIVRALSAIFHPKLNPGAPSNLNVSQEEIASLSGYSRQRCNRALVRLRKAGVITTNYRQIGVVDFDKLRAISERGFSSVATE